MARLTSLTIAAVAVVFGVHSGSPMLALAALCGAGGVASFANEVVDARQSA
jgi:nitrate/nitrite transporter NarK